MPPDRLLASRVFREEASREGFTRCGVARAVDPPPRFERFESWLDAGRHAGMRYLEETRAVRADPDALLPGAQSIVCLAAPHPRQPWVAADGSRFARYARGADYHGTLRQRALRVAARAQEILGDFQYRVCVDSTPLAERSFAAAAGLGWIGKNGCLIDVEQGSYLLLAEILTDLDLPADSPVAERCGSCVRCLEACPTGAFLEPGLLDAGRCLAYWTIEHRGPIPDPWKQALGDRVFGCDACQEACPWNAPLSVETGADSPAPTRSEVLAMGKGGWRRRFGKTAVNRATRRGLQRNAAASAGARHDRACLPALQSAQGVQEPGLADAAAWARERLVL
jgi:epoxyqueuosine reductase